MLKLQRTNAPECLILNAAQWTDDFITARQTDTNYRFSWRSNVCYEALRSVLSGLTKKHCSFCDGAIGSESRETIEHFRPKSLFPELAYTWDNLFICCDVCQCKGDRFDELLLKPDESDYFFERYFIKNYKSGEIEPNPAANEHDQVRALITINLYQLNKDIRKILRLRELKRFTYKTEEESIDDFNYRFFLE